MCSRFIYSKLKMCLWIGVCITLSRLRTFSIFLSFFYLLALFVIDSLLFFFCFFHFHFVGFQTEIFIYIVFYVCPFIFFLSRLCKWKRERNRTYVVLLCKWECVSISLLFLLFCYTVFYHTCITLLMLILLIEWTLCIKNKKREKTEIYRQWKFFWVLSRYHQTPTQRERDKNVSEFVRCMYITQKKMVSNYCFTQCSSKYCIQNIVFLIPFITLRNNRKISLKNSKKI